MLPGFALPGECVPRKPGLQIPPGVSMSLSLTLESVRVSRPSVLPLRAGVLLTVSPSPAYAVHTEAQPGLLCGPGTWRLSLG